MKFYVILPAVVAAATALTAGQMKAVDTAIWNFVRSEESPTLRGVPRVKKYLHANPVQLTLSTIGGVDVAEQDGVTSFTVTAVAAGRMFRGTSMALKTVAAPDGFAVSIQEPSRQLLLGAGKQIDPQVFHVDVTVPKGTSEGAYPITFEVSGTPIKAYLPVGSTQRTSERRYVYAINDYHGRLPAALNAGTGRYTGAVALAETLARAQAANPGVLVSAGDNIGATLYESSSADDIPTMDVLKAMGLKLTAVGNHEFDSGYDRLVSVVRDRLQCPLLGSNVLKKQPANEPALDPPQIIDLDGVKIGFVGVVTSEVPSLVSAAAIENVTFGNAIAAANAALDQMKDQADVWILLAHQGAADGTTNLDTELFKGGEFAEIVTKASPDFKAVMMGHTHQQYQWEFPRGSEWMPVIQTGSYAEAIAVFDIAVDVADDGTITFQGISASNQLAELEQWWGADQTEINDTIVTTQMGKDVFNIVSQAIQDAEVNGKKVLGRASGSMERGKDVNGLEDRGIEGPLTQAVADAMLEFISGQGGYLNDTVIAIVNPGGVRDDLIVGESPNNNVTERMVANILPFANTLTTSYLTGDQICTILNQQWQPAGAARNFLHLGVAGLTYSYDQDHKLSISDILGPDGNVLDAETKYRVATNNFLQAGGDNFFEFAAGENASDTGRIDSDSLRSYFTVRESLKLEVNPPWIERAINKATDRRDSSWFRITGQDGNALPGANVTYGAALISDFDLRGPFLLLAIFNRSAKPNQQYFDAKVVSYYPDNLPTGSQLLMQGSVVLPEDIETGEFRVFAEMTTYDGNPLPGGLAAEIYPSTGLTGPPTNPPTNPSEGVSSDLAGSASLLILGPLMMAIVRG